jgi:RNA polymerase sigma-70 factor (ECF subfamily)
MGAIKEIDFAQVYESQKEKVWRLISRYVFSKHDREDLFQEVFLKIHQALPGFRGDASLETWVYRVTANTAINFLDKQKRYAKLKNILGSLRLIETGPKEDTFNLLRRPLKALNSRQRMILIMAEVEELKLEEIAQALDIALGTVKSNLYRAKEIVRKELKKYDGL